MVTVLQCVYPSLVFQPLLHLGNSKAVSLLAVLGQPAGEDVASTESDICLLACMTPQGYNFQSCRLKLRLHEWQYVRKGQRCIVWPIIKALVGTVFPGSRPFQPETDERPEM